MPTGGCVSSGTNHSLIERIPSQCREENAKHTAATLAIVRMLLDFGADVEARCSVRLLFPSQHVNRFNRFIRLSGRPDGTASRGP
jgi:hypothetical protein